MFRWGIMGGGFISSQFAKGLEEVADMQVEVLASRSGRNDYGIQAKKYCCSYEELVNDKVWMLFMWGPFILSIWRASKPA